MIKIKLLLFIAAVLISFFLGTLSYRLNKDIGDIPWGWVDDGTVCKPIN